MSVILKLNNFGPSNAVEKTYLNADAAAAAVGVTLKNAQSAAVNLYLLIGAPAQENTELRLITALSGVAATVAALDRAHNKYDDVTILAANKIQVYRAANVDGTVPDDGDFSTLGSPLDIDYDNLSTRYNDATGGSGYWYKYTYINSQTSAETDIAESEAVRGGSPNDYCTILDIQEEAGIEGNQYISEAYIAGQRTRAQSVINSALKGTYTVPFTAPVPGVLERMTILLAAGYILKREFGEGAVGTNADGQAKIDEVMRTDPDNPGLLQQVLNGTLQLVDDVDGTTTATTQRVTGWPNSTTEDAEPEDGGAPRKFRASMRF